MLPQGNTKFILIAIAALAAIVGVAMLLWPTPEPEPIPEPMPTPEPVVEETPATTTYAVIGQSVEGRDIEAYSFGTGDTHLLFVGGIHGGYEANTVRMAELAVDAFLQEEVVVPSGVTVHIIPNLNPDGYALAPSASDAERRFNANMVDLNRNFDCRWAPESTWRGNVVSAGTGPFSEPEAAALRDYVASTSPVAAAFWHSTGNAVFTSECGAGVLPETETLMETYAAASGYGEGGLFDLYPITGDAEGWLATLGIPAVTVEFETREGTEWERNRAGIEAVMNQYAK